MSIVRKPQDQNTGKAGAADDTGRVNATLRESGVDYRVEPGATFDVKAFTSAALKRWPKIAARLAE